MATHSRILAWKIPWTEEPDKLQSTGLQSSVQFSHSVMSDSEIPWIAARQDFLSITNAWSLFKLMSIE